MPDSVPFGEGKFHLFFEWEFLEFTDLSGDHPCPPHQKAGKDLAVSECRIQLGEKLVGTGGGASLRQDLGGKHLLSSRRPGPLGRGGGSPRLVLVPPRLGDC